jgi:molybdopterin-guanine dinucleotide biosynthesis protein A
MVHSRSGWVLAGGRSSRMGSDKALLDLGAGPLACRVAELVAQSCPVTTLVGDPALYGALGFPITPDNTPGLGPLAGIEAALAATTSDWNLIVACDMPSLNLNIFESLFTAATEADCALPRHADGRVEPLCAVYHKRCHPLIHAALASGVRKVTDGLRGLAVRYVLTDSNDAFANLNTPGDVRNYSNG